MILINFLLIQNFKMNQIQLLIIKQLKIKNLKKIFNFTQNNNNNLIIVIIKQIIYKIK